MSLLFAVTERDTDIEDMFIDVIDVKQNLAGDGEAGAKLTEPGADHLQWGPRSARVPRQLLA